jgi:Glycosyl transferase family 2
VAAGVACLRAPRPSHSAGVGPGLASSCSDFRGSLACARTGPARATRPSSVSVIVPAYNAAATLAEQLEALAAQRFEALAAQRFDGDWELVIVDNGPPTVPRIWRGATGSASEVHTDRQCGPPRRAARRHARSIRGVFQGERVIGG